MITRITLTNGQWTTTMTTASVSVIVVVLRIWSLQMYATACDGGVRVPEGLNLPQAVGQEHSAHGAQPETQLKWEHRQAASQSAPFGMVGTKSPPLHAPPPPFTMQTIPPPRRHVQAEGEGGGGAARRLCSSTLGAREGTSDKTRVGRTKDDGAVTVQRKSPGTMQVRTPPASTMKRTLPTTNKERAPRTRDPRSGGVYVVWTAGTTRGGAGHLGLTHTETQRGRLWTA